MKKLSLLLLLTLSLLAAKSQTVLDTVISSTNVRIYFPPNYATNTDSSQAIIFFPGLGEIGTDTSLMKTWGPVAYMRDGGWNRSVVLGNGTHYPFIIIIQPASGYKRPYDILNPIIAPIVNKYRIKKKSVHVTGPSMGGWETSQLITYQATANNYTYPNYFASAVVIQGVLPDDTYDATPIYATKFRWWALNGHGGLGGRWAGFEQSNDGRDMAKQKDTMNSARPGTAFFFGTSYGAGEHGHFNRYYGGTDHTGSLNGQYTAPLDTTINGTKQTIYQFMMRQGDTTLLASQAPNVNAGADINLTQPTNQTNLSGTATDPDGTIVSVAWAQITGPNTAVISLPFNSNTNVSGLIVGTYIFRLTATDNTGVSSFDEVNVLVVGSGTLVLNAGTDFHQNRKVGFAILKAYKNQPSVQSNWKLLNPTIGLKEIGHIMDKNKDTTVVTILPYDKGTYFLYEDSVNYLGTIVRDTVRIDIDYGTFPPQSTTSTVIRMANSSDIANIPGCTSIDAVVTGANDAPAGAAQNTSIFIYKPSGITLGPGAHIWLPKGEFLSADITFDTAQAVGTHVNPIIVTNTPGSTGGQFEASYGLSITNIRHAKITGKYVPNISGNINYPGHATGYGYNTETYGLNFLNYWQSLASSGFQLKGRFVKDIEMEFFEVGNGGFAGIKIAEQDVTANDYDSLVMHDVYGHDSHGEMNYWYNTSSGLSPQGNGVRIYNNRFARAGNEIMQIGRLATDNILERNIFQSSAMNWRSTFETNFQAKGLQFGVQNGKNWFRNNLMRGSGDEIFGVSDQGGDNRSTPNGDTAHLINNLFDFDRGFIKSYIGGTIPVVGISFEVKNNLLVRTRFRGDSVYFAGTTYGNFTNQLLRTQIGTEKVIFKNNTYDNSRTSTSFQDAGNVDSSGNVLNNSIAYPQYVNSGFPDSFNYARFDMYTYRIMRNWGNEYGAPDDSRFNQQPIYDLNDYVTFISKIYRSKVSQNQGHIPMGVTDNFWELQTWTNGVKTFTTPPDDFRLKANDYYNLRGMGLMDNISNSAPVLNKIIRYYLQRLP